MPASWLGRGGGSGAVGAASAGRGRTRLIRSEKALIGSGGKSGNGGSCCGGGDCPSLAVGDCCFFEVDVSEVEISCEVALLMQGNGGGVPLGGWLQVTRRVSSS